MKILAFASIILAASTIAALAQSSACQPSASKMSIGGVDVNLMKCQLATAADAAGSLTSQNIGLTASMRMQAGELAQSKAEVEKLQGELAQSKAEVEKLKASAPTNTPASSKP